MILVASILHVTHISYGIMTYIIATMHLYHDQSLPNTQWISSYYPTLPYHPYNHPILPHTMSRLKETSIDAFILRIYREQNRIGFVKAVTEEPEYIQNGSSLLLVGAISSPPSTSSSCYLFYSIIIMITTIITMIKHHYHHHNRHHHHYHHHNRHHHHYHHLFSFI